MANETPTADEIEAIGGRYALISRWAVDTISTFEKNVKTHRPSDLLCITTMSVCSTYCNAVNVLLLNGLRMPTKAILRILFEVSAKVLWCLAEREADDSKSAVADKIEAWAKASLRADTELRRDYLNIIPEKERDSLEQSINDSEKTLSQSKCDSMPRKFCKLLTELGDDWHKRFYPQLYRQFNDSIHLDFVSLCSKATDNGTVVSVTYDSTEPIEELAQYWTINMHIILVAVRSFYGWDIAEMNNDFRKVNVADGS
ncbi:MAG: hypothetical protein JW993_01245 [Sedimentisphaerales bacterium]|nr:hypothetical protein [Sedimentisphaerales bacterium]